MPEATTITLPQDADTPPRQEDTPLATLLLASRRSEEAIASDLPNEDYVTFRYDDQRLALTVADGVGQSFFGELAARFLGEKLVDWLWDLPPDAAGDSNRQAERLFNKLHAWTEPATEEVKAFALPKKDVSKLARKALERRRENGSACVFAGVLIDGESLAAFWLGNTQLRLWDTGGEEIALDSTFATSDQWSSAKGPLNTDVVYHLGLPSLAKRDVARITIHTDGVHQFAEYLDGLNLARLQKIMSDLADDPASDDVSLLDVTLKRA